jgi:hypothetical protein
MVYHILNGDALAHSFPQARIEGEVVVMREALIEGDVSGNSLNDFWQARATHHGSTAADYHRTIVKEFEKIINAPSHSEFNLWFEFDLFCQVNMWFVISVVSGLTIRKKIYAVYSSHLDRTSNQFWNGFGLANSKELTTCFKNRTLVDRVDEQLGQDLWKAYKNHNLDELVRLSNTSSNAFPYLGAVVEAHVARFPKDGTRGRPEKVIEDIIRNNSSDFREVLKQFWSRESIYGFGDTQIKYHYDKIMGSR